MSIRRISSSLSSCLDSVDALLDAEPDAADDGEEFFRDGGRVGAIFLGGNHLGDKGVGRVVDGLDDPCRAYSKLYLCDNRIGWRGTSVLSNSLRFNTSLVELSLGNNHIGDEGARCLASALRDNHTLEMLDLENNNIGPAGTTALASAMECDNDSLQGLVLSENPTGDDGVTALLRCIGNASSLDHLQRSNHSLQSITLKKVAFVSDKSTLRRIQCYLKINRMSVPCTLPWCERLAAQRKVLFHVREDPKALVDFFAAIREENATRELGLHPFVLSFLGCQYDLSSVYDLLRNSPHLFSDDPDIAKGKHSGA